METHQKKGSVYIIIRQNVSEVMRFRLSPEHTSLGWTDLQEENSQGGKQQTRCPGGKRRGCRQLELRQAMLQDAIRELAITESLQRFCKTMENFILV